MLKKRRSTARTVSPTPRSSILSGKRGRRPIRKQTAARGKSIKAGAGRRASADYAAGLREGRKWRAGPDFEASAEKVKTTLQDRWIRTYRETGSRMGAKSWKTMAERGKRFATGFMLGAGTPVSLSPVPLESDAAAVVCAGQDASALRRVVAQLEALPLREIVIVAGRPADSTYEAARSCKKAVVAVVPDELDPDIGRALGAKLTGADIVLFVDGEQDVHSDRLASFLWACDRGLDIALNDQSGRTGAFARRNGVERLSEFLNVSLMRGDLRMNSLSSLPFALSRRALDTLGAPALAVPAKAQARAILSGLRIGKGGAAGRSARSSESLSSKAAGDHAEAWREALGTVGNRLRFADATRNRGILGEWER
ncbi:hypothetical protein ACF3MZ_14840 [Paenibacillaceae bacterium WGS1546]|uniref:hypothetical protein n=1 Tax=Cohnella sp. WGS1546 TaxID=3366810 RepID=UPI00372D3712